MQLDVFTDILDSAHLLVFVRLVFDDFSAAKELLCVISLKKRYRGRDIYEALKAFIERVELPLHKLTSITTDVTRVMIGVIKGFVALCRKDEKFPNIQSEHRLIHRQGLASKRLNTDTS